MDVLGVMQSYILKLLEEAGPGMKVLLLDGETTPGVSLAFAQSALMRQEVFLFERLRPNVVWEDMRYLKCICILRPDPATISQLCSELGRPRYQSYYVHFTNILLSGQPKLVDKEVKICETPGDWPVLLPGEMSHKVCPV